MKINFATFSSTSAGVATLVASLCFSAPARAVSSAEVLTNASYRYGRFEQRMQVAAGDGVVSSAFLWKSGSEMSGTFWNELDFEKINADCSVQLNAIYGLPSQNHTSLVPLTTFGLSDLCGGYHTYAYEWTPSYIAWSIDGKEVRRDSDAATVQAYADNAPNGMQFHFNVWPGNASFGGTFTPSELPVHQFISWVQYSAYTPGAGDGGGDFTLAWRESFDGGFPSGWGKGSWASPLQQSTHSPSNVNVVGGILVLSLTDDAATGFTGTPPADSGELPSMADNGVMSTTSSGTGSSTSSSSSSSSSGGAHDTGSGCTVANSTPTPSTSSFGWAAAVGVLIGLRLKRRAQRAV